MRSVDQTAMASFVMVATDKGVALIKRTNIRGISLADKNPVTTRTHTSKVRQIAMHVSRGGKSLADFQVLAFSGGFTYGDDIAAGRILANQILILQAAVEG